MPDKNQGIGECAEQCWVILYNYSWLLHYLYARQEPKVGEGSEQCWEWFCIIIVDSFTNYMPNKNQKSDSVLNNAESDSV